MGEVVALHLATRRVMPRRRAPVPSVNLDAIGRIATLMVQIAVLEVVSEMPIGTTVVVVRDGADTLVVADQTEIFAEGLMDAKDDLLAALGSDARDALHACREAFKRYAEV